MQGRPSVQVKRVYVEPAVTDGCRVLVERLWPRGVTKERARIDTWLKAIAPSTELRTWYAHDRGKWPEFLRRYHAELDRNAGSVGQVTELAIAGPVTLIYAAADEHHNSALALRDYLHVRLHVGKGR